MVVVGTFSRTDEGWQCGNRNCNVDKGINRIIRGAGEIKPKEWWVNNKRKINTTAFSIKLTGGDGGDRLLFPSLREGRVACTTDEKKSCKNER